MSNPISQITQAKDKLVESVVLLETAQNDARSLQLAVSLDSLLLDLVLPKEATPAMRATAMQLRQAVKLASANAQAIDRKMFTLRNDICETLMQLMAAEEMCNPLPALPSVTKLLESSSNEESVDIK